MHRHAKLPWAQSFSHNSLMEPFLGNRIVRIVRRHRWAPAFAYASTGSSARLPLPALNPFRMHAGHAVLEYDGEVS